MGFAYAQAKAAEKTKPTKAPTKKSGPIPIQSLNQMGCKACPNDKRDGDLRSPKLQPAGSKRPAIYLLGASPSVEDDDAGIPWSGVAGDAILSAFSKAIRRNALRMGHITQCAPAKAWETENPHVDVVELECCRPRIVRDIEETKPLVVVGVGDQPLNWATGLGGSSLRFRGQLIATKIGNHSCWYCPLIWPNYAFKKKKFGKSEYELAVEHDVARLEAMLEGGEITPPWIYEAPFDRNIELIGGSGAGDFKRLESVLASLAGLPRTAIDIETSGLRPYMKDPLLISAAIGTYDYTLAFPIHHPEGWATKDRQSKVMDLLGEFLLYSNKKIAHNLAMEQEWLAFYFGGGLLRRTEWGDTMAMCHTLDEREGTKSLDVQTRIRFGFFLKAQSRVDVRRPKWWLQYPLPEILRYNGLDTKWTDMLATVLLHELDDEGESQQAEYQRKVDLCPTLVLTQAKGLNADLKFAQKMEDDLGGQVAKLERKIQACPEVARFSRTFGNFSPTNSNHVLQLLKDICKRAEVKRVDRDGKVSYSSDEEVLSALPKNEVPSASLILEHRGVEKLRSTYLAPVLSGEVISFDGLIHSTYASMVAVTGRLNSYDPNIQNWPKRKHKEIRGIVYARKGEWMVAADYGQIEFRVVGMASGDDNLVKYCWTGYDVHGFWAQRMVDVYPAIKDWIVEEFQVDWDEKGLKTLRQEAKNGWVFPQLFGSSLRSCGEQLHLPEWVTEELGAEFWDQFPGVKKWQGNLLKFYEKHLYVETLGGRRRRGPMTKNEIINMPIQGTATDIVLEGMNALSLRADLEEDPEYQPSLNVHDDLSTFLRDQTMERKIDVIVREMCLPRFDWINVPLVVEVSVGPNWADLQEIAKYRSDELFGHTNPYK